MKNHKSILNFILQEDNPVYKAQNQTKENLTDSELVAIISKCDIAKARDILENQHHLFRMLFQISANKIKGALETIDIKLLDHVIVTKNAYFSFADEGLI